MKDNKQKLELTWIGKHNSEYNIANIEPRILQESPDLSNCKNDANTENKIIHGDNLLALKALLPEFEGKVKCIYIDPPYNTGNAFEHYDDAVEHSTWLSLMKPRLELLRLLLSEEGFLALHIDDSEGHYIKALLDETFGRNNYLTTIYVKVRYSGKTLKQDMNFHKQIEQIHIYRKTAVAKPVLSQKDSSLEKFCFYIKEKFSGEEVFLGGKKVLIFKEGDFDIVKKIGSEDGLKEIWASGTILDGNSSGRFFRDYLSGRFEKDGLGTLYRVEDIGDDKYGYRYFTGPKKQGATKGKYFQGVPMKQLENPDNKKSFPIDCFLDFAADFGNCRLEGGVDFRSGKKPEVLLQLILKHFSNENDLILDSFLGSGTTVAVAHKMNRRYIGIEMGDHAYTHCKTRLDKVIAGEQGGISKALNWQGGGAYKFYELAPSFITKDEFGNLVIDAFDNDAKLIQAMCKLMNFKYQPSQEQYWKHGVSSGKNYLFVTTQILTCALVAQISSHLGENESLIICSKNFESGAGKIDARIAVKKIPQSVLKSCNFGKKEYLLPIKENKALEELSQNEIEEEND